MTEDQLQSKCVIWGRNTYKDLRGFGIVHIPNGGTRHKIEAAKLVAMGVAKGMPDLIVIMPDGHVFFIEMKDDKGKQSKEQMQCEEFMIKRGIEYYLMRTEADFQQLINKKVNDHPAK